MTTLPTYEQLVIELYGTLEALAYYSKSRDVSLAAKARMKEINCIRKGKDDLYVHADDGMTPLPNDSQSEKISLMEQEFVFRWYGFLKLTKNHTLACKSAVVYMAEKYKQVAPAYWWGVIDKISDNHEPQKAGK